MALPKQHSRNVPSFCLRSVSSDVFEFRTRSEWPASRVTTQRREHAANVRYGPGTAVLGAMLDRQLWGQARRSDRLRRKGRGASIRSSSSRRPGSGGSRHGHRGLLCADAYPLAHEFKMERNLIISAEAFALGDVCLLSFRSTGQSEPRPASVLEGAAIVSVALSETLMA